MFLARTPVAAQSSVLVPTSRVHKSTKSHPTCCRPQILDGEYTPCMQPCVKAVRFSEFTYVTSLPCSKAHHISCFNGVHRLPASWSTKPHVAHRFLCATSYSGLLVATDHALADQPPCMAPAAAISVCPLAPNPFAILHPCLPQLNPTPYLCKKCCRCDAHDDQCGHPGHKLLGEEAPVDAVQALQQAHLKCEARVHMMNMSGQTCRTEEG